MADNFERMLQVIGEVFDTRNDPDQISVNEEERELLEKIHPATLSELANEDGPIVWILLLPTTTELMKQFINGSISEKQLLYGTPIPGNYDAIYLCSASVLPEFRKTGLARKVTLEAIGNIRKDHPIKTLFYWPFTNEGRRLAESIAIQLQLPLHEKPHH
jgi:hypothetical protein